MGPYAGVDYNSLYLIVNSVVSYAPPLQRGKVWSGKHLSYWLSTFVARLLISMITNRKRKSTKKGKGRGEPYVFE
jgi:hypothetical protein